MTEDDARDDTGPDSGARETVLDYYDALRAGDPLGPFFADDEDLVKFGISERLVGGEEVADGLREQTETTSAWTVDSRELRVTERDDHAWFSDEVFMGWTGTDPPIRYEFETRWSGTLERRDEDGDLASHAGGPNADVAGEPDDDEAGEADDETGGADVEGEWQFVGMHVSTAGEI